VLTVGAELVAVLVLAGAAAGGAAAAAVEVGEAEAADASGAAFSRARNVSISLARCAGSLITASNDAASVRDNAGAATAGGGPAAQPGDANSMRIAAKNTAAIMYPKPVGKGRRGCSPPVRIDRLQTLLAALDVPAALAAARA
jgi:hypothetical protein